MRFSAEVPSLLALGLLNIPLVDGKGRIPTLDHEPVNRIRLNNPTNLALKLIQSTHVFEVILSQLQNYICLEIHNCKNSDLRVKPYFIRLNQQGGSPMKDPFALLVQKETELQRVRREIEALRAVLPLLAEDVTTAFEPVHSLANGNKWPLEVNRR